MTANIEQEIQKLMEEIDERYSRLMCLILEQKYGVEVRFSEDGESIIIDGVEMDPDEFSDWLIENGEEEFLDSPLDNIAKA